MSRVCASRVGIPLVALAVAACRGATAYIAVPETRPAAAATAPVARAEAGDTLVQARFHNVHFHVWPGVALQLDELDGHLRSRRPDHVVSFDDARSFEVDIDDAVVGLATDDLARLMNTYVFAYSGAPLRDLSFRVERGQLVQAGVLHKVVDIPFEMRGTVSVTPAGEIRIHPVSMKICTIPGKGLMDALGITLAKLLDLRGAKGVRADGDDLLLDPTTLLPPPAIAGHLARVELEPGRLVQYFGDVRARPNVQGDTATPGAASRLTPDSAAANYMLFHGGTLQFGRLFMVHADMEVVDLTPADPFDFDIARYHEQLVAGYHRTLHDDALLVFMPDLDKIASARATAHEGAPLR